MAKSKAQILANKERVRELLTDDVTTWSRECPLPYPPEFERSIDLLEQATRLAVKGDPYIAQATDLIMQMDDHRMRSWFDDLAQNSGKVRLEILGRKPEKRPGKSQIKRPTKSQELRIIRDQGFHCRYCGIRIVPNDQLKRLQKIVTYDVLPNRVNGKMKNTDMHGIWLLTCAAVDHVDPVSNGGDDVNRPENLVACCWSCNYGKWSYSLDELELNHPCNRKPIINQWQGLTDIL